MPPLPLANDPTPLLDQALTRAVQLATGIEDVTPRPGQSTLSANIIAAMASRGQTAGCAPTGVGKTLSYLTPAMLFAAVRGERTVLSTESLALQAQIVEKDAPVVADAVEEITGTRPTVAVLKGWSNYACASKVASVVAELSGTAMPQDASAWPVIAKHVEIAAGSATLFGTTEVDGTEYDSNKLLPLLGWAVEAHTDNEEIGDRSSAPVQTTSPEWAAISLSPDECPGKMHCPFGEICKPANAKDRAADADLVVTNHAYLAVQASTHAPIVIGSKKLGTFRHLILDECHTMPGQVRSAGAKEISAFRVHRIIKAIKRAVVMDPAVNGVLDEGQAIADHLDSHLSTSVAKANHRVQRSPGSDTGVLKVASEDTPLEEIQDIVKNWAIKVKQAVAAPDSTSDVGLSIKLARVHSGVESLMTDIRDANIHETGQARWIAVAAPRPGSRWAGHSIQVSPVDVAQDMRNALYTANALKVEPDLSERIADVLDDEPEWDIPEHEWTGVADDGTPRYDLSVTAVSATLPPGFTYDSGMNVRVQDYPSPFDDAYGDSVFFVPSVRDANELDAITSAPYGKRKFDTLKHQRWAADKIVRLVKANGGSALVLSATARAGREYAAKLRAELPELRVLSQWGGSTTGQLVADWRADTGSVLVGTRSLMTGVDAPGTTCNLVIIDRVPRAAGNPVDDARVEAISERQDIDRWAADRMVYVSDAVLLLEQAYGRLIRRATDSGLVSCLDPRLLKTKPLAYQEPTRKMLLEASKRFTRRLSNTEQAEDFLRAQRSTRLREAS